MTHPFEQVATTIAERLAQLLAAQVAMLDAQGKTVATSKPNDLEGLSHTTHAATDGTTLRIPIHFNGQTGKVLITISAQSEAISFRPAQMLVELMLRQATTAAQCNQHELKNKFIHDV